MLLWADTGLFFPCQVRYLYEGREHLLVLFKIRATPLDTIRSVMIIRGPEQPDQSAIEQLFAALLTAGNQHVLPPYLLTQQNPVNITSALYTSTQSNKDLHRFGFTRGQAVVYGCLSSWEDTLRSPQLSLAVHPSFRNRGFAHAMCCQLHDLARIRGARSVRALISKENHYAIALCRSFGYKMTPTTDSHLHGSLELQTTGDEHNRWVA